MFKVNKKNMSRIIYSILFCILYAILTLKSSVICENESTNSVSTSRMTRIVERQSENVRLWLCNGEGMTPEQWTILKTECINPRINQLAPENAINAWQQCSQRVNNLCDDQQWTEGKECAKDMLKDEDVGEMQMWYRTRLRQMTNNFQIIKNCYQQQKKNA